PFRAVEPRRWSRESVWPSGRSRSDFAAGMRSATSCSDYDLDLRRLGACRRSEHNLETTNSIDACLRRFPAPRSAMSRPPVASPGRPGSSALRSAYDAWHNSLPTETEANSPWHRLLAAHLDADRDLNDKAVLEIGCGRGGFACRLARQPRPPTCLIAADFSANAIAKGRAYAAH